MGTIMKDIEFILAVWAPMLMLVAKIGLMFAAWKCLSELAELIKSVRTYINRRL
jgi:hypothetical protein